MTDQSPPSTAPDLDADAVYAAAKAWWFNVSGRPFERLNDDQQNIYLTNARAAITAYLTASPLQSALDEERRRGERLTEALRSIAQYSPEWQGQKVNVALSPRQVIDKALDALKEGGYV